MPKTPPLPRSLRTNPVGQVRRYKSAAAKAKRHNRHVRQWLMDEIDAMRVESIEVNASDGKYAVNERVYQYLISAPELRRIISELQQRIGETPSEEVVSAAVEAYREGTGLAVESLRGLTDQYTRELTAVLRSDPWLRRAAMIESRIFEEMEGFAGDTGRDLARVLSHAVETGQNPMELKRTLRKRFRVSDNRAEKIARTEVTGALRRGRLDESEDARERLGIRTMEIHLSALLETTRESHAARHGNLYSPQEAREWWTEDGNGINCYLPGTRVRGRFVAGSKARYDGMAVRLVTASGRDLSVTPNHPVMTDRGLVAAGKLREGDRLVSYRSEVDDPSGVRALNGELADARIEDVFSSLMDLGHSSFAGVGAVDFHGDGEFIKEDVEIVDMERPLVVGGNTSSLNLLDDIKLVFPNPVSGSPLGSEAASFNRVDLPASGGVSGRGSGFSFFSVCLGGLHKVCFAMASVLKAMLVKPAIERDSGNPGFFAKLKDAFAFNVLSMQIVDVKVANDGSPLSAFRKVVAGGPPINVASVQDFVDVPVRNPQGPSDGSSGLSVRVFTDNVISVERFPYSGHVYDLQEVSGMMIAQDVIASNCRCSSITVIVDEDGNPTTPALVDRVRAMK